MITLSRFEAIEYRFRPFHSLHVWGNLDLYSVFAPFRLALSREHALARDFGAEDF